MTNVDKFRGLALFALFNALQLLGGCSSGSYLLGAGAYSPALSRLSSDASAKISTLAPLSYPIAIRAQQQGSSLHRFESIDVTPLPKKSPEGGMDQYHSQIRLGLSPSFASFGPFEVSFFTSAHFNMLAGKGLAIELNNGTGTDTFYTPGGTHVIQTLNLGCEIAFVVNNDWMITPALMAETPFSSTRRQWAGAVSVWYRWKGKAL